MPSGAAARAGGSDDGKPIPLPTTMSPPISTDGAGDNGKPEELGEPKARKACINCRKQKMKCRLDNGKTCRRCYRAGVPCIFVPRANAAGLPTSTSSASNAANGAGGLAGGSGGSGGVGVGGPDRTQVDMNRDILQRLHVIEDHLGLGHGSGSGSNHFHQQQQQQFASHHRSSVGSSSVTESVMINGSSGPTGGGVSFGPIGLDLDERSRDGQPESSLWKAVRCLRRSCPPTVNPVIWQPKNIEYLWQTFHERMPGLHFLPDRQKFSSPHPLLLASILYCSSMRGEADVAILSPHYFVVVSNAIAQLSVPDSPIVGEAPADPTAREEWAFQTVLGIVIAGLLREASTRETGIWISIAYRLILEHCPPHVDERSREWRKLFSGVQIVDLEHASLHMSCPVIPIEAPLPTLHISHRDQLYRLSRMMHTGLTHFTGRGLPTIWSCFNGGTGTTSETSPNWSSSFTSVDAAVIRDWARQLDEWLVEFSNEEHGASEQERTLVFRQYILHRLTVLSIYHPARGCNLYANGMTPKEQFELLLSARAAVKLHLNDTSIWANWDFVMITWAALIVIQGIEGGAGEPDDLRDINVHLNMLKATNEPTPSLRDTLITRLEKSLQGVQTPGGNGNFADPLSMGGATPSLDYSWHIFDHASLEQMTYPSWGDPSQMAGHAMSDG